MIILPNEKMEIKINKIWAWLMPQFLCHSSFYQANMCNACHFCCFICFNPFIIALFLQSFYWFIYFFQKEKSWSSSRPVVLISSSLTPVPLWCGSSPVISSGTVPQHCEYITPPWALHRSHTNCTHAFQLLTFAMFPLKGANLTK